MERGGNRMIVEKIKLYEDREDVTLTTYVLDDSEELHAGKKRPAIIVCPGGAYLVCSDREAEPVALRFAAMGYHVFVLRYSVYLEKGEDFQSVFDGVSKRERTVFPSPIRDIGAAMLLLREKAEEWLIDIDRIGLCGFSAGAHNVATYSVYWNHEILTDYFNVPADYLRPATTIAGYMLSDYFYMRNIEKSESDAALFKASAMALLGTETPDDEALHKVSPALLVNEETPPMFLWSTSEDALVPVGHTTRMATALADQGIPFEVHIFEDGPHGLSLATQATANKKDLVNEDAAKWVELVEKWLMKRFALEIPE